MTPRRKTTKPRRKSQAAKSPRKNKSQSTNALDTALLKIRRITGITDIPASRAALKKIPKAKKEKVLRAFKAVEAAGVHYVKVKPSVVKKAKAKKTADIIPIGKNVVAVRNKSGWTNAKVKAGEPFKGQLIHTQPLGDGEMQLVVFPDSIHSITEFEKAARKNKSFQNKKTGKERFRYAFPSRDGSGKMNFTQIEFSSAAEMAKHMLHYLPDEDSDRYEGENERLWDNISIFRVLGKNEMIEERLAEQEAARIARRKEREKERQMKRKRKERGG